MAEKVGDIIAKGRFLPLGQTQHLPVELGVILLAAIDTWEQHFVAFFIDILGRVTVFHVLFAFFFEECIARLLVHRAGREHRAKQQRTATILLALEIRNEVQRVAGVVFVDRRVIIRPHQHLDVGDIADQHERQGQQARVDIDPLIFVRPEQGVDQDGEENDGKHRHTAAKGHSEGVDKEFFKNKSGTRQARNDTRVDDSEDD